MAIRFRCPRHDGRSDHCPARQVYSCLTHRQDTALGQERIARRFGPGQVVIHHDTPALAVLAVHSGLVKLTRSAGNGHEVMVGLREPGELLGVREVLTGLPYQVSAQTLRPSVLCSVPREAFLAGVHDCPELADRLLRRLAKDYLHTEEQLATRAHTRVFARTARLLSVLGEPHAEERNASPLVSMSREELASLVGTTRETLSRSLRRLVEHGAVQLRQGGIRILDRSELERLSDL